MGKKPKKNPKN